MEITKEQLEEIVQTSIKIGKKEFLLNWKKELIEELTKTENKTDRDYLKAMCFRINEKFKDKIK